jgi:tetratricopeptide (TPR) repeat protein
MKRFHDRDFEAALPLFESASQGLNVGMAHTAQLHARMCAQRVRKPEPAAHTIEDSYNLGVALINQRQFKASAEHLLRALNQAPDADHILYALALCRGLEGDYQQSAQYLSRAISIAPSNRNAACRDADFQTIAHHSPLRELLQSERNHPAR